MKVRPDEAGVYTGRIFQKGFTEFEQDKGNILQGLRMADFGLIRAQGGGTGIDEHGIGEPLQDSIPRGFSGGDEGSDEGMRRILVHLELSPEGIGPLLHIAPTGPRDVLELGCDSGIIHGCPEPQYKNEEGFLLDGRSRAFQVGLSSLRDGSHQKREKPLRLS